MHQVTGEPLMRRSDDTADKLRSRLKAFHQQTQPVIDYYERAGKNVTIDAKQDKNVSGYVVEREGGEGRADQRTRQRMYAALVSKRSSNNERCLFALLTFTFR